MGSGGDGDGEANRVLRRGAEETGVLNRSESIYFEYL